MGDDNKVMCDMKTIKTDENNISDNSFEDAKKERYKNIKEHYISILKDIHANNKDISNIKIGETTISLDKIDDTFSKNPEIPIPDTFKMAFGKSETLHKYLNEVHKKTEEYFKQDIDSINKMELGNKKIEMDNISNLEKSNDLLKEIEREKKESKTFENEYVENSSITNQNGKFNKIMIYSNYAILGLVIIGLIYINIAYNFFKEQTKIQIKPLRNQ